MNLPPALTARIEQLAGIAPAADHFRDSTKIGSPRPAGPDLRVELVAAWCRQERFPEPVEEYPFARDLGRKFRFDCAWPSQRIALEWEGLTHAGGRHQRIAGYSRDCEKYSLAAALGWRVIRVTGRQFRAGACWGLLEKMLVQE